MTFSEFQHMRKKATIAEMERAGVTHNKETHTAGCFRAICLSNRRSGGMTNGRACFACSWKAASTSAMIWNC
jgi:hypothetical protein